MSKRSSKEAYIRVINNCILTMKRLVENEDETTIKEYNIYNGASYAMAIFTLNKEEFRKQYHTNIVGMDSERFSNYSSFLLSSRPRDIGRMLNIAKIVGKEYYQYFYDFVTSECDAPIKAKWEARINSVVDYDRDLERSAGISYKTARILATQVFFSTYGCFDEMKKHFSDEKVTQAVHRVLSRLNERRKSLVLSEDDELKCMVNILSEDMSLTDFSSRFSGLSNMGVYIDRIDGDTAVTILKNTKSSKNELLRIFREKAEPVRALYGVCS